MIRRTSFAARAGLLLFGLLAGLAAVEAALRAGGWGFRAWQELRNERSLRRKASCVILCLGESTTDAGGKDSYPDQLEKILNRRLPAVKFTVLNKALPGLTSHAILSELEGYLAEYKPDIVTAMMGINDVRLGNAGGPRGPAPSRWRLAKLWSHVRESFAARRLARAPGPRPFLLSLPRKPSPRGTSPRKS
jgi:lysophospholipase L1-like esterase